MMEYGGNRLDGIVSGTRVNLCKVDARYTRSSAYSYV